MIARLPITDRDRLIVALDVPTAADARRLVEQLGDQVTFYKVGLELVLAGEGLALARELKAAGKQVFLDVKLLDIANTVEKAVAMAALSGVDLLTIHAHDRKTMAAAARGRAGTPLKVIGVTVLTHLDAADVAEQGARLDPATLVLHRAKLAAEAGIDGVVASGQEAAAIRAACAPGFLIVTPGIRPRGGEAGDQARITTPADAIAAGADHIVVGRPITQAADPAAAAAAILEEIAAVRHP